MRTHPIKGKELLGNRPFYQHAADIAVAHHERFDGSGYPYGVHGKDIPLSARIVAVVDIYDALTSRRPYKEPWTTDAAFTELDNLAGHHLDPFLVNEFLKLLKSANSKAEVSAKELADFSQSGTRVFSSEPHGQHARVTHVSRTIVRL